ncbi:Lrp/AsnC ligand binding domain-containing protein [Rhodococcus sp. NPDC058505]|uniref:Lrp/AsnC ligand binding domain-containing protein n=1 Tax=unclassified Rhodococcus (in: high G+C Gram-positive bacteria) TaxID=192944 RepID=UPI00364ACFDD
MAQAYILIQTEVGRATVIADRIRQLPGVLTAEDVTGPYDVVVRVDDGAGSGFTPVVERIQRVAGITRTLTCEVATTA